MKISYKISKRRNILNILTKDKPFIKLLSNLFMLENIRGYVQKQVFLDAVVRACIYNGLRVIRKDPIQKTDPDRPHLKSTEFSFDIVNRNTDLPLYKLQQLEEEEIPKVGRSFGRYFSTISRLNGSTTRVLETCREWTGYESRENDYGRLRDRTTLHEEDELARAVLEDLRPLIKPIS